MEAAEKLKEKERGLKRMCSDLEANILYFSAFLLLFSEHLINRHVHIAQRFLDLKRSDQLARIKLRHRINITQSKKTLKTVKPRKSLIITKRITRFLCLAGRIKSARRY